MKKDEFSELFSSYLITQSKYFLQFSGYFQFLKVNINLSNRGRLSKLKNE